MIDYAAGNVSAAIRDRYPKGVNKALNGVSNEAANEYVSVLAASGHMIDLPHAITVQRADVRIDGDYVVRGDGIRLQMVSDPDPSPQIRAARAKARSNASAVFNCRCDSLAVWFSTIHHRASEITESAVAAFFRLPNSMR